MDKRRLATIFAVVFVDVLGFGLILPLLPYYATRFGASAFLIGLLTASYSVGQIIGSPILGRLSDRFGRRPILMVSIAGTAVSFLILGWASALWVLFAGRLLDGLNGANFTVAQSHITDLTPLAGPPQKRKHPSQRGGSNPRWVAREVSAEEGSAACRVVWPEDTSITSQPAALMAFFTAPRW